MSRAHACGVKRGRLQVVFWTLNDPPPLGYLQRWAPRTPDKNAGQTYHPESSMDLGLCQVLMALISDGVGVGGAQEEPWTGLRPPLPTFWKHLRSGSVRARRCWCRETISNTDAGTDLGLHSCACSHLTPRGPCGVKHISLSQMESWGFRGAKRLVSGFQREHRTSYIIFEASAKWKRGVPCSKVRQNLQTATTGTRRRALLHTGMGYRLVQSVHGVRTEPGLPARMFRNPTAASPSP